MSSAQGSVKFSDSGNKRAILELSLDGRTGEAPNVLSR